MGKVRIAIIGAGNISNTRHLPALNKVDDVEVFGVIGVKQGNIDRTRKAHHITNELLLVGGDYSEQLKNCEWFKSIDAVVIGAPPLEHYPMVKASLMNDKHVLVEKPMMLSEAECNEMIKLARAKKKIFYVMHNFQYASKMLKLNRIIQSKRYGEIENITEVQFTNHDRRLPEWYNELPMGLFYDEAAHFVYLLERHGGNLTIDNSYAVYDGDPIQQTPETLTVNAMAGKIPVTMMLNFRSPVCEWYYMVAFKKQIFIYDFFKDILISLPTDNEHLAGDILKNSIRYTWQYWVQFIGNGVKMMTGNLLYGHDVVLRNYVQAVQGGEIDSYLTAENGRKNVLSINEIVDKANQR